MKEKILIVAFALLVFGCGDSPLPKTQVPNGIDLEESFFIHVNLHDQSDDSFKVEMFLSGLTNANDIFQFAATMPGIYSYSDAGKYVYDFVVTNKDDEEISSDQIDHNQWQISTPENVRKITYKVHDTFDSEVPNTVYPMAGTSIAEDHVLLNTPMVFGYPTGLKDRDYYLSVDYSTNWTIGTALPLTDEGLYHATDYDLFADSPLIFAALSKASTIVGNTDINVHVYSQSNAIAAADILNDIEQVLLDAKAFLKVLPTDHYDFLFHFGNLHVGALEHAYSSVYVLQDRSYTSGYAATIKSICAHEFFHIVTPLNIHSEIIGDFNFATPTPSQHLWLYEGVTEWASDFMQFRNGSMSLDGLLGQMETKVRVDINNFDPNYSLTDISNLSYTPEGNDQFVNIYFRGAMIASLLDIRLLELSNGKKGLREVILELIDIYGPENSFSEDQFFEDLVALTYPEIADFMTNYIKGTTPLPISTYYLKLGIEYDASANKFSKLPTPSTEQTAMFAAWSVNM